MGHVAIEASPMRLEFRKHGRRNQGPTRGINIIVGHQFRDAGALASTGSNFNLLEADMERVPIPLHPAECPEPERVLPQAGLERLPGIAWNRAVEILRQNSGSLAGNALAHLSAPAAPLLVGLV